GTAEFYKQTAQALVDLLEMDRGLVLMRHGDAWNVMARAFRGEGGGGREFSRTILQHVVQNRRTFCQAPPADSSQSTVGVDLVVASPVFDAANNIVCVVYGSRSLGSRGRPIDKLEAQIVQLLAATVTSGLVRMAQVAEAHRLRVGMEAAEQAEKTKSQF